MNSILGMLISFIMAKIFLEKYDLYSCKSSIYIR